MNLKLIVLACILSPLALTACSKQENAPVADQSSSSEVITPLDDQMTAEQQAAIDALDQPMQDEHNTDVPESVANAAAEQTNAVSDAQSALH